MKILATIIILVFVFVFASCKADSVDNLSDTTEVEVVDTNSINPEDVSLGKEYTSHYICPNHCLDSGSKEPGECPVCGMEYIENLDSQ